MDGTSGSDAWDEEPDGGAPEGGAEPEEAPAQHPPHLPAPWETDDYLAAEESEEGARRRHDAFTPARRKAYLKALAKSGCVLDACREVGVSSSTVYRLQGEDAEFLKHCALAIGMAGTPAELTAWERGVVGVEEPVIRGGKIIGTRLKRSDAMLRLLLQGSNPKKYGARPGFQRNLLREERKRIEQEVRSSLVATNEEVGDALVKRLKAFGIRVGEETADKEAAGWTKTEDGHWIPPGWVRAGDAGDGSPDAGGREPSGEL